MSKAHRWVATVTYNASGGPIEVDYHFEEIRDLHNIIERGPDWNAIADIKIVLNEHRRTYDLTLEGGGLHG